METFDQKSEKGFCTYCLTVFLSWGFWRPSILCWKDWDGNSYAINFRGSWNLAINRPNNDYSREIYRF